MHLKRTPTILHPDQSRVLLRPFSPGGPERIAGIIARIMAFPDDQAGRLLDEVSERRRLLIGSYFLAEYSLESAALFNPSIVPHPDQAGLPPGALRFVLSLRATGEGHISSITFRTGVIDAEDRIEVSD